MGPFLIGFLVFGAAFAGLALGPMRGRPLEQRECDGCPLHDPPDDGSGGAPCRP